MSHLLSKSLRALALLGILIICENMSFAQAEPLSSRVLSLYPQDVSEIVFVDLREARRSSHFDQMQAQILPPAFRSLERLAANLGVDFSQNVDRLSWAYVNTNGNVTQAELLGVAEGPFDPEALNEAVRTRSLPMSRYAGMRVFSAGTTEAGREFVFAFTKGSDCVFGFREDVQKMLIRSNRGGTNVNDNDRMRRLVDEANHGSPVWAVMNSDFVQLGVRQLLGNAIGMPGLEGLGSRVQTATVTLDLGRGLTAKITVHCATPTDALWFSRLLQAALLVERQLRNSKSPDLARVLGFSQVQREEDRVKLDISVPEKDLAALIETNSLSLHF
jgi:hypothetical protein